MTPAKPSQDAPIAGLPLLAGVLAAALAVGGTLAWAIAGARGWNARVETVSITDSSALGVLAVAVAAVACLALVWSPTARTPRLLGMRILAAGSARLMIALFVGVILLVGVEPEGRTFLTALSLATLACKLGELAWGMSALRRHTAEAGTVHTITPGAAVR